MQIGIGVSAGTDVVCAALVVVEDDGSSTVEYRTVSADHEGNTDTGDLVVSAIELMASLTPAHPGTGAHQASRREPDSIAVSCRSADDSVAIDSALARSARSVSRVPEADAAHAYLDDSGLIARYGAVALVDVGASGTSVSLIDAQSGDVHADERTDMFGGNAVDRVVRELVHERSRTHRTGRDERTSRSTRFRFIKEQLTVHDSAEIAGVDGPVSIHRTDFDDAVRPHMVGAAEFVNHTTTSAPVAAEALVMFGGGANMRLLRTEFDTFFDLPVIWPTEPDTVLAKGAAHLALTSPPGRYPVVGTGSSSTSRSIGKYSSAAAGALVVGGLVLAYAFAATAPEDNAGVSPAGSAAPPSDTIVADTVPSTETDYSTPGAPSDTSYLVPSGTLPSLTAPSTTPSLHPAPDLPVIPWPAEPSDTRRQSEASSSPSASVELRTPEPSESIAPESTPPPVATTPETGTPESGTPETTPPDPTSPNPTSPDPTPSPDGSTELPPNGDSGEVTTPVTPNPEVSSGTGADEPNSEPSMSIPQLPTTDADASPPPTYSPPPTLSPPPTVWTPPPTAETPTAETSTTG